MQRIALEILGHLAAMAESMSPFQPHQVRLPVERLGLTTRTTQLLYVVCFADCQLQYINRAFSFI